jgi:hypothetical protein
MQPETGVWALKGISATVTRIGMKLEKNLRET